MVIVLSAHSALASPKSVACSLINYIDGALQPTQTVQIPYTGSVCTTTPNDVFLVAGTAIQVKMVYNRPCVGTPYPDSIATLSMKDLRGDFYAEAGPFTDSSALKVTTTNSGHKMFLYLQCYFVK